MIKSIEITNFKGIKEKVTLDLKPITLLFGPNSAGKSSIIHALHYATEILERKNFDPKNTQLGGNSIELGGFKNLVHEHDLSKKITLKFDFDLSNTELPIVNNYTFDKSFREDISEIVNNYKNNEYYIEDLENRINTRTDIVKSVEAIHEKSESAYISITTEWLKNVNRPEVSTLEFGLDNEILMRISIDKFDSSGRLYPKISHINFEHPNCPPPGSPWEDAFNDVTGSDDSKELNLAIDESYSVIPDWEKGISLSYESFKGSVDNELVENDIIDYLEVLSRLIVGLGKLLITDLGKFIYIGPIRKIPPRNFDSHFLGEKERWAEGLAAWDLIYTKKVDFETLNKWLSNLKINYELQHEQYLYLNQKQITTLSEDLKHKLIDLVRNSMEESELDLPLLKEGFSIGLNKSLSDTIERIFNSLKNTKDIATRDEVYLTDTKTKVSLKPYDIGVGISQILPVIVGVLHQKESILAIEQPELHLHPAIQVELADLFISQINEKADVIYLLETHSEHLMLRYLRRIEETYKNKVKEEKLKLAPDKINVFVIPEGIPMKGYSLPIDKTGEFEKEWPNGFFEEREEELFPDD